MKVAMLQCDIVPEELSVNHGTYPEMYQRLLNEFEVVPYRVFEGEFPHISDYQAFICSGSRLSVYDDVDWIRELSEYLQQLYKEGKRFVGICFGHQMIAHALGGMVEKAPTGYLIGVHSFSFTETPFWILKPNNPFNILMMCQDQIKELPENSTILAANNYCPIGMFTVGSNFLGIQGHPEFSKAFDKAIYDRRKDRISGEKRIAADESMATTVDKTFLQQLIRNFILR